MHPVVRRLDPGDEAVAQELVGLINRAYAAGEAGLWKDDPGRTDEAEIAEAIRSGHMLVATVDGRITGCLRTRAIDATTADAGLIAAAPDAWGAGTGRALLDAAETSPTLAARPPCSSSSSSREREPTPTRSASASGTRAAATRSSSRLPLEEFLPHVAPLTSVPGDILIFKKQLRGPGPLTPGRG